MAIEIITFDELTHKIESSTIDNQFRICGESLLAALNDWPTTNLKEPKGLLFELKNELKKTLTFDHLKDYSDGLKIDISGNVWRKESINSLLEMFDCDKNIVDKEITLDKIIERLTYNFKAER